MSEEKRWQFELDEYIRLGKEGEHSETIKKKHEANLFKLKPMPKFKPGIDCLESIDDFALYNKA